MRSTGTCQSRACLDAVAEPCEVCGEPMAELLGVCHRPGQCEREYIRRWLRSAQESNEAWCAQSPRRKPYPTGSDLEWLFRVLGASVGSRCQPAPCTVCGKPTRTAYLVCTTKTRDHVFERRTRLKAAKYGGALWSAMVLQDALERLRQPGRPCRYAKSGCEDAAVPGTRTCPSHARADAARRHDRLARKLATSQDWTCSWCDRPLSEDLSRTHVDHVIPVALGGPDVEWNLQVLHDVCNLTKSDRITPQALGLAAEHGIILAAPRRRLTALGA